MHKAVMYLEFFPVLHFGAPCIFSLRREIHAETSGHSLDKLSALSTNREADKTASDNNIQP